MENIGIDISKNTLDVKALPSGKLYQFTNDKKGVQMLYKTLSMTLVLEVSELGKISNKEIAALVGLAPITKESGNFKGKNSIFGGRKGVRCALSIPNFYIYLLTFITTAFH